MSTTTLDPAVAARLRHFGQRRVRILVTRGICAGIVAFLTGIAVVAFIDWSWIVTDRIRWCLSGAVYAITLGVLWFTSLRKLWHHPPQTELAARVEEAAPELREHLLSAVELATEDPDTVHDSIVFRGLLQDKVARQMGRVNVASLLPLKLLGRWLLATLVIVTSVVLLLSLPDPRFRLLAARAIMPGANIERISRIQVNVLQPTPNSLTIASDETVAVAVAVTGGRVDDVILETRTSAGVMSQQMRARADTEFVANIQVGADSVQYRILAGDAITKRYTITARPRPQVVAFHKTFQFPDYSGLQARTVAEDHGDLLVLEGTQAQLQLELNQNVSAAELRIATSDSENVRTVALQQQDDGRWSTTMSVTEPGVYKVHLVSAETGFENIFSPRYEIRPLADLIPRAGFVGQQDTNLLLPPNDILALKGMAEDDLPLVKMEQEISVNGQDWVARPVAFETPAVPPSEKSDPLADAAAEPAGSRTYPESRGNPLNRPANPASESSAMHDTPSCRVTAAWDWDLLGLQLQTGDQVLTRLVATDRKGNRGESVPLRITVAAPDFDPLRHALMQQKASLYDDFLIVKTIAEEHQTTAHEIIERLKQENDGAPDAVRSVEERALDRNSLGDLAAAMRTATADLLQKIHDTARGMPAGADAYDLDLAGQLIGRLRHEHPHAIDAWLTSMQHTDDTKQIQKDLDQLKRTFDQIKDDAHAAAYHFQHLMSHNVLTAVASDFDALLRQQKLVASSPTQTWLRLLRQETVVLNQLDVVERLMQEQQDRLPDHIRNQLRRLIDWTAQRRLQLEQATESEDKLPELQRLAQTLLAELDARQRIDVIDGGLPERLNQARREFQNRAGTLSEPIKRLAEAVQEENRVAVEAVKALDSTKAKEFTELAARFAADVDLKYRPSLEQLRVRRSLTQSRADADSQFAADAGLTSRASNAVLSQHRHGDPADTTVPDALKEIAAAYGVLEAGHDMQHVQICLTRLIQMERWNSQELAGRLQNPRQWDVVNKGLEEAIHALRRAGVKADLMSKFDRIRWSPPVQRAHRKISQRRSVRDAMIAAGTELMELRDNLRPLQDELDVVMADARAVIAKYAPGISKMAEQIAQQVRELEQETLQLAEAAPDKAPAAPGMPELKQQQDQVNRQMDDLFEALVDDANQQDLLDDKQRERARDADDSIAMVQEPARQMNKSLDQADRSETPQQQAQELAQAAEAQEKTAQALDKVAAHFDRLENDMDVAESRAELRQFERDQGIARQIDQNFKPTQELAGLARQAPADLLKQLEEELRKNPAMQQALSEISQNTIEQAKHALQDAANTEQQIQQSNERSDEDFQAKKKELADQLKELGRDASQLSRQLVAQANSASAQAKAAEAQKKFAETQQKLNEAASAASSAHENVLQQDLARMLQQTHDALQAASETLQAAEEKSAAARPEDIHNDDKKRQAAKKTLEDQRKRFIDQLKREADGEKRRLEGQQRQADQHVKNAQNTVRQADRQVQQAKSNLKKKPEDQSRQRSVDQAEARRQDALEKVDQAKQAQQTAKQRVADAIQERDTVNKMPTPALNDKNPAAQLAQDYAQQAKQRAAALQEQAAELAKNVDFGEQLVPTKDRLNAAADEQQQVQNTVAETAENLARAARHEGRLEKLGAADALQQAADNVRQVEENEVQQAKQQLQTAQEQAPDPQQTDNVPGDNKSALAANAAVGRAEDAIGQQADALATSPASNPESAADEGTGDQSQPGQPPALTADQIARGQQLAQVLDELDRQTMAANGQTDVAEAASEGSAADSSTTVPSLAQAARAQQSQQGAARAKAQQQQAFSNGTQNAASDGIPAYDGLSEEFVIVPINRDEQADWGQLREKAAEDLTKGRREAVSEEYRRSVETYFRVLAERARKK